MDVNPGARRPDPEPGPGPGQETELGELAGVELQHELHLALPDWTRWASVAEKLQAAGAELQTLQLSRQDGAFTVRCRVRRLAPDAARKLAAGLVDEGVAAQAEVEHLVLSKRYAGAA